MNSMKQRAMVIWSVFLRATLLAAVAVAVHAIEPEVPPADRDALQSQAMCQDGKTGEGRERMCDGKMKAMHDKMAADLQLDDKQRQLFDDATGKMHAGMKEGMGLHKALKELVQRDDYDEAKVRALVQKYNAERETNIVAAANAMHAFRKSLTPEQASKFKAMREEMKENMMEKMKSKGQEPHKAQQPDVEAPAHSHEH